MTDQTAQAPSAPQTGYAPVMIASSVSFHPRGDRSENAEAVGEMTVT